MSDNTNARTELLEVLTEAGQTLSTIDYGYFHLGSNKCEFDGSIRSHQLALLDRDYDSGYGGQELSGTIVFKDGTWLERGEYDGSEWWEYKSKPSKGSLLSTVVDEEAVAVYRKRIADPETPSHLLEHFKSMLKKELSCGE